MAKIKKLFGNNPEDVNVLAEVAKFDEDGIAEVSEEAYEVFRSCPGYETIDEDDAKVKEAEELAVVLAQAKLDEEEAEAKRLEEERLEEEEAEAKRLEEERLEEERLEEERLEAEKAGETPVVIPKKVPRVRK
jgi:DNA helicase-2/ATP-dependent DNA helicase PcrA